MRRTAVLGLLIAVGVVATMSRPVAQANVAGIANVKRTKFFN